MKFSKHDVIGYDQTHNRSPGILVHGHRDPDNELLRISMHESFREEVSRPDLF